MKDVVDYMLKVKTNPQKEVIPIDPNFEEKIIFNKLSEQVALYLKSYRINDSNFIKNELRDVFNGLYNEALSVIPDATNKSDEVFFYIYEKAYPQHTFAIDAVIFTLMSYYFEYCDIFKAPEI